MIILTSDIRRDEGVIKLPQLGGGVLEGYAKISMHKPTGVIFMQITKNGTFDSFVVGLFSKQSLIEESEEYKDNNQQSFFEAVKYFESLIEKLTPEKQQSPPSVGKFYFYKEKLTKDCKVNIFGNEIIIQRMDIPIVFSPPKTKPFGRLNMTAVDKPEYMIISSKFALKYNEKETKEDEDYKIGMYDLSDFAVYDMTPYQNAENAPNEGENEGTPEELNDKSIDPNDIENEDMNDKENKQKDKKKDKKDKDKKDDKKQDKENEEEKDGDDEKQVSEKKQPQEKNTKDKKEESTDEDEEESDKKEESTDEDEEESDKKGEPTDEEDEEESDRKASVSEQPKDVKLDIITTEDIGDKVSQQNLISGLEKLYTAKQGLKDMFKKQSYLLLSIDSMNQNELNIIYKNLNIPQNYSKSEFIKLVTDKTQTIF